MLLAIVALVLGFIGGFIVGVKNANSSKISKAKEAIDIIKK